MLERAYPLVENMAWKCISFIVDYWLYISLVHIIILDGSSCNILSITRSSNIGDSFEVQLENETDSVCQMSSCEQFGGFLHKANQGRSHSKCSCYCGNSTKPTFYSTKSGKQICVNDIEVLKGANGDICDFYTDKAQHLEVLDLRVSGKARMKPDGFCEHVRVSEWKFYFNTLWISSTFDSFSTITVGNNGSGKTEKIQTFLTWDGNLGPFYKGLLIKVMIRCTYRGITDDRCVMLKAQGTHVYHEIPRNSPTLQQSPNSPPTNEPASSTVIPKAKGQTKSEALPESKDSTAHPKADLSDANTRQIWLIVALGLSAVVLIAIIVITGFLVVKCRRNCRKRQRTGSRNHLQVPVQVQPRSEENPAMHDYEYVHYPCLVEGGRAPPATPIGNRKYERGQDNKLIIWTPGRSPLPNQNNQSTGAAGATAPRLPYQRLLTRTSSSSPDVTVSIQPVGTPAAGEGFPYQKLIRTVSAMGNTEKQGCCRCQAGESTADAPPYDEALQKPYQSLSLSRNPLASPKESDTGYMRMEGAPRPESTYEYDYTEPLELNKPFRISHGEMDRGPMEVSIGDLSESASNLQQQQQCDEVRLSVISNDQNYEDVEKIDVRKQQRQQRYDKVRISKFSIDENYENVENTDFTNSLPSAVKNDEGLELKSVKATSYEDLSGDTLGRLSGGRSDLEEYVEMGKRRSMLIEESPDQSGCHGFAKIEEEGPEYFVLEGQGNSEGKADDKS